MKILSIKHKQNCIVPYTEIKLTTATKITLLPNILINFLAIFICIGFHLKSSKKFGSKVIERQFFYRKTFFIQTYGLILTLFPNFLSIVFLLISNLTNGLRLHQFSGTETTEANKSLKIDANGAH